MARDADDKGGLLVLAAAGGFHEVLTQLAEVIRVQVREELPCTVITTQQLFHSDSTSFTALGIPRFAPNDSLDCCIWIGLSR